MAALLELKNLHYSYGAIHVLKGISMFVEEGETVALIGSNGAGKTTTLRAISGLIPAKGIRNDILFEGKPIQGMSGDKIAQLGVSHVFEGRHVFSKLTVEENLLAGGYLRRRDKGGVRRSIEEVYGRFPRLQERKNQLAGTLSGGEQQMLAIGRALVGKPRIVLFDEPSLGLAPLLVKEVFAAINKIRQEGTTILLVEQNSKLALKTAQRGYVLKNGEIALSGRSEDLLQNEEVQRAYLSSK
ncbi:MAG: ABC transporter ATP-binding protein [Clostridiales bacterium]|nr:ABC transporter ATP-binding protein [Clostridiales bacterium]